MFVRLRAGLVVTNLGQVVPRGLWVAFYIYFIGMSVGSFLLSSVVFVFRNQKLEPLGRIAVLQAFFCLVTGLILIMIDPGHWERFYYVLIYPQLQSVLAWEIWFYLAYIVILLGELWLRMRCNLARWANEACGWRRLAYRLLCLGFHRPTSADEQAACDRQTRRWLFASPGQVDKGLPARGPALIKTGVFDRIVRWHSRSHGSLPPHRQRPVLVHLLDSATGG